MPKEEKTIGTTLDTCGQKQQPPTEETPGPQYVVHPKDRYWKEKAPEPLDANLHELYLKGQPLRVKARRAVMVDGKAWEKGQEGVLTFQQHRALGVHFDLVG